MTGGFKKKKVGKYFAIFVLVGFLSFSALSSVMYLASPKQKLDIEQMKIVCEESDGIRDEDVLECVFENVENVETQESCEQNGGTWYDENNVCIK